MQHFPRFTLALCLTTLLPLTSQAHDLWLTVPPVNQGQALTINMGYGHDFPNGEPIAKDRQQLFDPIQLISASGTVATFAIDSEKHIFIKQKPSNGSYLVLLNYKPTSWSVKTVDGKDQWQRVDKTGMPGGFCMESRIQAKAITFAGTPAANEAITRPQGARLEFVPLVDPMTLKMGDTLKVRLLAEGKPLKNHQVGIAFADPNNTEKAHEHHHHHHDHGNKTAYSHPALAHTYAYESASLRGDTDDEGILSLPLTNKGIWMLISANDSPYKDKSHCDVYLDNATFTFFVRK